MTKSLLAIAMLLPAACVSLIRKGAPAVWTDVQPRAEEFLKSVRAIERGKRVLVVHGGTADESEITHNDLMHAASLATIRGW